MAAQPKSLPARDDAPWGALSDNQRIAAERKVAGKRTKEIAESLGINRTTVYRWLKQEQVMKYVDYLDRERRHMALLEMREATSRSLRAVSEAADSGDTKAALGWLSIATKFWEGGVEPF